MHVASPTLSSILYFQAQTSNMQADSAELCERGPRHGAHICRRPGHERGARARPRSTKQPGRKVESFVSMDSELDL